MSYTLEELQKMGAKPIYNAPPVAPEKSGLEKTSDVLGGIFGGNKIGEAIGNQIAKHSKSGQELKNIDPQAYEETFQGPTGKQIAGDVGRVALNFLPVGKIAGAAQAGLKAVPLINKVAKPLANIATGAATGVGFGVANNISENKPIGDDLTTMGVIGGAIPAIGPLARGAGMVAKEVLGKSTGEGAGALGRFVSEIRKGGTGAKTATEGLRGKLNQEEIAKDAFGSVSKMIDERRNTYLNNLDTLGKETFTNKNGQLYVKKYDKELDKTLFVPTDLSSKGLKDTMTKTLKSLDLNAKGGSIDFKNRPTLDSRNLQRISDFVYNYDDLTPKGLDNLRQEIEGFRKGGVNLSPSDNRFNLFVDRLSDNVKKYSEEKVPQLKKLNSDYTKDTQLIRDIQKSISLGGKNDVDQAFQKLSKVLRGNSDMKKRLLEELNQVSGGTLVPQIVGTQFSHSLPGAMRSTVGGLSAAGAGLSGGTLLPIVATLASFSPRAVGELARILGLGLRGKDKLEKIIFGSGANKAISPGDVLVNKFKEKKSIPLMPNKTSQ